MFDLLGVKPGSDLERIFKAVGFVVVQWGAAEQSLDSIVATIFRGFRGHSLVKCRPILLGEKLNFLKECFAEMPHLHDYQYEAVSLFGRFEDAGKLRNDMIHGAISRLSILNGTIEFSKIDVVRKEGHTLTKVVFNEAGWPSLRKELLQLGEDGWSLAQRVLVTVKALEI